METEHKQLFGKIPLLVTEMEKVIKGKRKQIEWVLTCLFAGGHILMEDNPGTGKTVLARTLAAGISGGSGTDKAVFRRIQFTPDLLPMDLIGNQIFNDETKSFTFKKGPLFTNILLSDEINRASPKVQSALLESMAEKQISIGDRTYLLDRLFFNIATQNPIGMEGTYPLPAAQLDRFFMKINFGYADPETEFNILSHYQDIQHTLQTAQGVLSMTEVLQLQYIAGEIYISDEITRSVVNLLNETRNKDVFTLGASTRAGIAFMKCLRALALVRGRDFVTEDDFAELASPVLYHRLIARNKEQGAPYFTGLVKKETDRLKQLKPETKQ